MPPLEFYRVQHDASRVIHSSNTGFTSEKLLAGKSYSLRMSLDYDLINEFQAHCNKEHVPTALISICSSPHLSLERANQEEKNGRTGVRIYKIYAGHTTYEEGGQPWVWNWHIDPFNAREFANKVKHEHWEKVIDERYWKHLEDEYLVLNKIPRAAVAAVSWNVQQFKKYLARGDRRGWNRLAPMQAERTRTYVSNGNAHFGNGFPRRVSSSVYRYQDNYSQRRWEPYGPPRFLS